MIPHSKPLITDEDIRCVSETLSGGNLSPGKLKELFEKNMSDLIGLKNAVAVSSGTAALYCTLKAFGISEKSEVIIPSYVCSALLYSVKMAGAIPVVVDSGDGDVFHIDALTIKKALTKKTKALIFPHMFGSAKDIKEVIALGVPVIEDCAMSLGSEYGNVKTGNLGSAASVFSFYATKVITTGEGGMVLSGDRNLIEKIRDFVSYADKNDCLMHFNFKMTDFAAALGVSQLKKLDMFIGRRRAIAKKYTVAFIDRDFEVPRENENEKSIYYRYVLKTRSLQSTQNLLKEKGIFAERPVYLPLSSYKSITTFCPNAEKAWETALSIPIYPALTDRDVESVIETILDIAPKK